MIAAVSLDIMTLRRSDDKHVSTFRRIIVSAVVVRVKQFLMHGTVVTIASPFCSHPRTFAILCWVDRAA
jgi:hypothetical protein